MNPNIVGQAERTWREELWWIASQAHSSSVAVAARLTGVVYHDNMDLRLCNGDSCKRFVALEVALDSQVRKGEADWKQLGDKYGRIIEQVARLVPVYANGQQLTNAELIDKAIATKAKGEALAEALRGRGCEWAIPCKSMGKYAEHDWCHSCLALAAWDK